MRNKSHGHHVFHRIIAGIVSMNGVLNVILSTEVKRTYRLYMLSFVHCLI